MSTHLLSLAVTRVNDDDHLSQMVRSSPAAERVDLPQEDYGHHVSGEFQVPCPDGREGQ